MQPPYWRARWRKSGWTRHLSGPISPGSHAICSIDESIASWVASLVSRTPSPEAAAECPTSATSGPTSGASRDRSEPPHSSSRTSAASFGAASLSCWKMLPPRGGMRNGRAFERRMSALRTGASACSSSHGAQGQLYPTPSATPYGTSQNEGRVPHDRPSRGTPSLETWAKGWRTPTATDWKGESARKWQTRTDGDTRPRLSDQVACWPTPTAQDASSSGSRNAPGSRAHKGVSLSDMVTTGGSAGRRGLTTPRDGAATSQRAALSPRFVEALMGFADGWTDCEDSATRSCPRRASAQSASS